jgi:hypothetical protein
MPFVNRFASPFAPPTRRLSILRNHPVLVASGAAVAGVLLGGFFAVQLLATPAKVEPAGSAPQAAAETKPAPPIAETTGSAPQSSPSQAKPSEVTAVDCGKQTWPYLSRDCLKTSDPRVVTTDRIDRSPSTANAASAVRPEPAKPAAAPVATVSSAPRTASNPPPAPSSPTVSTPAVANPDAATPVAATVTESKPTAEPAQAANAKPKPKYAKKWKRQPVKPEVRDGDDDNTVASGQDDEHSVDRRPERSRRVVQRGSGRNNRAYDDDDDRPTVVIRRGGGGGGLFGLFNFGGRDNDD